MGTCIRSSTLTARASLHRIPVRFHPDRKIPAKWHDWIDTPATASDPLENQLRDSAGNIKITQYRAGTYNCTESSYPQNGNVLSQLGSKARDDQNCGTQNWSSIVAYYYTGSTDSGVGPPAPNTSYTRPSHKVSFSFPAQVTSSSGAGASNVGWRYQIDACFPTTSLLTCQWTTVYERGWSSKTRTVPVSYDYTPPTITVGQQAVPTQTNCFAYRVRAHNPSGWSKYASYNSGAKICPGA